MRTFTILKKYKYITLFLNVLLKQQIFLRGLVSLFLLAYKCNQRDSFKKNWKIKYEQS